MAVYHGKNMRFYIGGYDISSLTSGLDPSSDASLVSYSVADGVEGYHHLPGVPQSSLSLDGLFDDNAQGVLNSLFDSETGYVVVIPLKTTAGSRVLAAPSVKLKKYTFPAVTTDINRLKADLVTDGIPWEHGKLLYPKAQKTTDGEGDGYDDTAQTTSGLAAYLQVFECGADDALIVKIQESSDHGIADPWADLITFTPANGITAERKTVTGTVERYLRVTWSGTPDYQATFAVAIKRN
jgi:hypothetical protein